jgi:uncharacterized surface protein with fasciclin (FAS1) repeats
MKIRKGHSAAAALIALGLLGAAGGVSGASSMPTATSQTTTSSKNIIQIAEHNHQLSTLVSALKAAGLVNTLEGNGPFTVFAPTNRAFAALPKSTLKTLLEPAHKALLASILTYHVVPGALKASQIASGPVKTVEGATFTVNAAKGKVTITDGRGSTVRVVKPNIAASNGVIHVINGVLLPPASS